MSTGKFVACALGLAIIAPVSVMGQTHAPSSKHYPGYFSDDGRGFQSAQPPTDEVLRAILETPDARDVAEELDEHEKSNLKSLFESAPARLAMLPEGGYVVVGHFPMGGGDNDWFWIVQVHEGNARVVLFERGDAIRIRPQWHHGFHDIELDWGVGGRWGRRTYAFNGSNYTLIRQWSHEGNR